jgi:membrane-associated protease RseP (regulator of RpoE activity)
MKKFPYSNLVLFVLTFLSTLIVGAMQTGIDPLGNPRDIYKGMPFALTLMTILLSHEFAHYFASKTHGVKATLPYFIPAPTIFGTFGAFIKMQSPITSRKSLVDIGASGPIAGFILSVLACIIGLSMSKVVLLPKAPGTFVFGESLLFSFLSNITLGTIPEGYDILLHPIAFAGWIGLFVTSMNLIPVGQLDGGHIAYALLGEKHKRFSFILVVLMAVLGIFLWEGWIVWSLLLLVLGLRHPPVIYWEVPLDRKRAFIGWLSLIIFILTFNPVPVKVL